MASVDAEAPSSATPHDQDLSRRQILVAVAVSAAILGVDQLTKWWALVALDDGHTIDLVGSLRFNLVFNEGSAFSLGSGAGRWFALAAAVISVGLLWYAGRVARMREAVVVGVVAGGAIGNLGDRLFRRGDGFAGGAVVDFVDLQWWPVFNVADMAIVVGIVLVALVGVGSSWND
ncbi:MAG: signal peptidase II [Acidimicrobiales bacterium]